MTSTSSASSNNITNAKNKQYRSDALAAVHEMMVDLHSVGAIDEHTMCDFDKVCLTPVQDLSAEEIRTIHEHEHASQTVFAYHLNVRAFPNP